MTWKIPQSLAPVIEFEKKIGNYWQPGQRTHVTHLQIKDMARVVYELVAARKLLEKAVHCAEHARDDDELVSGPWNEIKGFLENGLTVRPSASEYTAIDSLIKPMEKAE